MVRWRMRGKQSTIGPGGKTAGNPRRADCVPRNKCFPEETEMAPSVFSPHRQADPSQKLTESKGILLTKFS